MRLSLATTLARDGRMLVLLCMALAPLAEAKLPFRPAARVSRTLAARPLQVRYLQRLHPSWGRPAMPARSHASTCRSAAAHGQPDPLRWSRPARSSGPGVQLGPAFAPSPQVPPCRALAATPARACEPHPEPAASGAQETQALDTGFTMVASCDSRVQAALGYMNSILDDDSYMYKIENSYIKELGTSLVVRIDIYLQWIETAGNTGLDGSGQAIRKACTIRAELIGDQIQSWRASEISAQVGAPSLASDPATLQLEGGAG